MFSDVRSQRHTHKIPAYQGPGRHPSGRGIKDSTTVPTRERCGVLGDSRNCKDPVGLGLVYSLGTWKVSVGHCLLLEKLEEIGLKSWD